MKKSYYDFALVNFKSAETMYKYTEEYDCIVVDCQQFLEKAFKHLLILKKHMYSRSHKLTVLLSELEIEEFKEYIHFLRQIQDYYFDKRYPGEDYIETTKEECDEVIKVTRELKCKIEDIMSKCNNSSDNLSSLNVFNNL